MAVLVYGSPSINCWPTVLSLDDGVILRVPCDHDSRWKKFSLFLTSRMQQVDGS